MKKKILVVIVTILIIMSCVKVWGFIIVNNLYKSIDKFYLEENRKYVVEKLDDDGILLKYKVLYKNNVLKYMALKSDKCSYYKVFDFNTNQKYSIDLENNTKEVEEIAESKEQLYNLPNYITNIIASKGITPIQLFKIRYIVPTTYDDKKCYKIVTSSETIIIDRDTYLPVYSSVRLIKDEQENKIEYKYEFEINCVTDEDVEMPDLTQYE